MDTPWTEDRCLLLDELWVAGQSASKIADQLGGGITRNAVIGKAARRGLPKHISAKRGWGDSTTESSIPRFKEARLQARKTNRGELRHNRTKVKEPVIQIVDSEIPAWQRRNLLELADRHCRYPVGEPENPDFFFCGAPSREGSPYCIPHHQRCYDLARTLRATGRPIMREAWN